MTHAEHLPLGARRGQSRDSERALFQRYHACRDPALRDHLVTRYLPMARRIARAYARRQARVPFEDLEQVASIGLIKSVDRFDPASGAAFVAFAEPTIRGEIFRHFREFTWTVRPPRELQERALQLERVTAVMSSDLGYSHAEDAATVMHLMRVLTPREKRVLLLRFGADLTQAEVGEIVGCT